MMERDWIFRLCTEAEWAGFRIGGVYAGGEADRRDGFIHFSTAAQIAATAARHYAAGGVLVLLAVAAAPLGEALKWEESRGGALFPHLYAPLPLAAVRAVRTLPDRDFGFLDAADQPTEADGWTFIP
ncbi:DUF952 domain-containing protein [Oleispirillum naphthae]|uniref:DUF952 domain-containing protein n=1 Tax=Oleispirillum naphthae TaxID=2838853 RepID=UPI003B67BF94